MKLGTFLRERQEDWDALESLIGRAKGKPERLGAKEVLKLGRLYRALVADVAKARVAFPDDPATARLEGLVLRARPIVYSSEGGARHPIRFLTTGFWRRSMERPVFLVIALTLLLTPALLGALWVVLDEASALGVVPSEFASALDPASGTDMGADAELQAEFSAFLITNNVTVAILAFAAGIFFGIGTGYVLIQNGLILGVLGGFLVKGGDGGFFLELAAAHGVLELSCIVVAAAAGLRMGWALVNPGVRSRREALGIEASSAVLMTAGIVPWLVVAGVIEAFVSRRGLAAVPMAVVGIVVGGAFWVLMWTRGRPRRIRQLPAV